MTAQHLLILRHGHTAMSVSGVYTGSTEVPLDSEGREAAASWRETLAGAPGFHSPLTRAVETAELAGLGSTVLEELREWDLGELEGLPAEKYRRANPAWTLFRDGAPGGESPSAVTLRARRVLDAVHEVDETLLVLVGHGQLSKALAAALLDLPLTAATRFTWGPARAALFSWRASVSGYALAGWNRTPSPLNDLLEGNS